MSTRPVPTLPHAANRPVATSAPRSVRTAGLLTVIVIAALALRVTAIRHGLPFAYNPDEELHFVPYAAAAADGDWNPDYFENPAALTYLLAFAFMVAFPGADMTEKLGTDPTAVFTVARSVVVLLGTALVPLVYWAGRRYFEPAVGLVAAAVIAVGFLPVYYSHQALNDVPTLLPTTVALVGCLLIYERGDWWTYLLAGATLGVAGGTKFLAAPMALVIALAVLLRVVAKRETPRRGALLLTCSGVVCVGALVIVNPYVAIEFDDAVGQLLGLSSQGGSAKLGQHGTGWTHYPYSLLWGFGVVPLLLALVGAVLAFRTDRARALLLITFPVVLYLYMGGQGRFFGRWMLPAYPALAILAGYGLVAGSRWLRSRPRIRASAAASLVLPTLVLVTIAQPLVDSVRSDLVLARSDTRTQARTWILGHVDVSIVVEPAVPAGYLDGSGLRTYPVERPYQTYETTLGPELVETYRRLGYCWVMVNSHQHDRGLSADLPGARAYYERLIAESDRAAVFSPYREGTSPPRFSFDFSFNWYPLAYERPGPYIEVRRLDDCSRDRRTGVTSAQDATE